ncbi:MAG: hypothetical protein MJ210_01390, partial [Alphaproteobacteria bacterium]|nr:hypothetical protein [Alphaproteobacteria bacterium]
VMVLSVKKLALMTAVCAIPLSAMAKTVSILDYNFDIKGQTAERNENQGNCSTLEVPGAYSKYIWLSDDNYQENKGSLSCVKTNRINSRETCHLCQSACLAEGYIYECNATGFMGEGSGKLCNGKTKYKSCKCANGYYAQSELNYDTSVFDYSTAKFTYNGVNCYDPNEIECKKGKSDLAFTQNDGYFRYLAGKDSLFSYTYKYIDKAAREYVCLDAVSCNTTKSYENRSKSTCVISTSVSAKYGSMTCYTYSCSSTGKCNVESGDSEYFSISNTSTFKNENGTSQTCSYVSGCRDEIVNNYIYGEDLEVEEVQGTMSISVSSKTKGDYTCQKATCPSGAEALIANGTSTSLTTIREQYQNVVMIYDDASGMPMPIFNITCYKDPVPQTCPVNQCDISCSKASSWIRYFLPSRN